MTVEELVAAVVALAIVSAKRLGAGLANRAIEGVEQSVADRLGRLYRWIAGRLPGEEGAALVDEAGRSPAAQALLRRRLVLALGEDPAGVEELPVLLSPHAPVLAHGDFLLPESSGIPRQLPLAVADFTGRGQELARLVEAAERAGGGRVCLVHGPGGIGKTAVVVQAAHRLMPSFPDGQLFVDLNGAEERPAAVGEVLGDCLVALGIPRGRIPDDEAGRTRQFRTVLADRRVLIVLDNAASEQQVGALMPGGSSCAVLITSRRVLATLAVDERVALPGLDEDTAWDLLRRIGGGDRVDEDPEAGRDVVRLCGGLPLALRIAGARLATFPARTVGSFARDLADDHRRLDVLSLGERSVRAVFRAGYQALPSLQQRAFRLLSALDTPDLPAWALSPLLDVDADAADACLEGLLLAHLVQARRGEADNQRIVLHDLARGFSKERAAEQPADEADSAVRRLLGALLSAADAADARLRPAGARHSGRDGAVRRPPPDDAVAGDVWEAVEWFEAERVVLVAAVAHAHARGWWELCWEITDAMSIALEHQWRWDISSQVHELALDAANRLGDGGARAALLRNLGEALRDGGSDVGRAAECFSEAVALFHSSGDAHGESDALGNLGILQRQQGVLREAARTLTEAERLFRALPLERGLAWTLREKAVISRHHAHYTEALAQLDEAQALFAANEETRGVGWILRTRADTEKESTVGGCPLPRRWYAGPWPGCHVTSRPALDPRWAAARTHYEHGAQTLHAVRDHRGHTWATLGLADMALYEGDNTAAELISRALQETDACGDHRGRSRALTVQALLHAEANRLSDAITLAEQALAGPRDHVGAAQASFRLARLYGAAGRHHDVLHTLQQSRTHYHAAGMPFPDLADTELCRTLNRPVPRASRFRRHQ
ncbi:NB-ARC domain-containing protein [Streptomyces sp. NPDC047880]|uniref:NB-ARC domain-containing protein n=1 Tax=Streptomyces sp. NPDC047880 TaxID=3155626 RepID=UPI00345397C3